MAKGIGNLIVLGAIGIGAYYLLSHQQSATTPTAPPDTTPPQTPTTAQFPMPSPPYRYTSWSRSLTPIERAAANAAIADTSRRAGTGGIVELTEVRSLQTVAGLRGQYLTTLWTTFVGPQRVRQIRLYAYWADQLGKITYLGRLQ